MTLPTLDDPTRGRGIWPQIRTSALRMDWTQVEPLAALRCTIGVGVPLVAALILHQPAAGVFIAVGAVSVGFGSFQGAYRSRAATMLLASLGMALSLLVGSLAGHSTLMAAGAAAAWGFAAGVFVSLGPAASFVGLQSAVAVLVAGAYPTTVDEAAVRGLLVFIGGLIQTLFVVSLWPLRRFRAERQTVGRVYRSLAGYAASLPVRPSIPPEPHTLAQIRSIHSDPQPFARSSELLVFRALLDQAERIRASLAALSLSPARGHDRIAGHLSQVLEAIAAAVEEGRAPAPLDDHWQALDDAAAGWRGTTPLDSLLGQLRAACRTATVPAEGAAAAQPRAARRGRTIPPVRDALMTLRANLSLQSTACRHGLRLAAALAFATAVYRITGLPRGYWFSMTTLIVLKPGFRETFVTGVTRIIGTLAGAALAALLVGLLGSHPVVVTALLLVAVWSGYALFRANYAVFAMCITAYVVLLLRLGGVPGPPTATYRALDTMLGGALALAIYRAWPTFESRRVRELLAALADALARDCTRLLGAYVDPSTWDPKAVQQTRAAARLARSNAEASVERMLGEPPARDGFDPRIALGLLAAFRRYALGALALHAGLDDRPARASPELAGLRDQMTASLRALAAALRTGTPPAALPPMRQTHLGLRNLATPALFEQTDIMVDSVNTAAALLAPARG